MFEKWMFENYQKLNYLKHFIKLSANMFLVLLMS